MTEIKKPLSKVQRRQRTERILGIIAIVTLIAAGIFGAVQAGADLMPAVMGAIPGTDHVEEITNELYIAWGDPSGEVMLGYVALGEANGYGGPMVVAAGFTPEGDVIGAAVASHKETPSWMTKVMGAEYLDTLMGKHYNDHFQLEDDVDGVTGATYTSRGIAESILEGGHIVADYVGLPIAEKPKPKVIFGIPEILLLALFAVGYIGHKPGFKHKKVTRWGSMIVGMIGLGFIYNHPLTITYINKFLMGFWPEWRTHLYWYLLIGGIFFVFSVENKNPYCEWFCPFGAVQECMGAIGGAKVRSTGRYRHLLKWLQRGLAWGAIFVALLFRNPGITSYEIFGTMFELIGSSFQFALLGIILISSLFIRRPWCTYLCPLHPVEEFIRMIRKWILGLWPKRNKTA